MSIPPQGTLAGQIRVSYSSSAAGDISDDPTTLEILDVSADLDVATTVLGQPVALMGPASASLQDPVAGTPVGNQPSFGAAMGSFHAFGTITCIGAICALGGLPSGTPVDGVGTAPLPTLTVASLHGTLTGLTFTVGGLNIAASLVFTAPETGRLIPEPAAALLLALGCGARALRRARA
ncbi:MAG TPA: hypothetical protein VKF60_10955 [Myxococcota bacterium]|nr:hypothetical protein [Myxococcota bacterium]